MKKNSTMRVAVLLIALTLITSCFVGGTFAKYISTGEGSDTVKVAKWSIKAGDTEIATQDGATTTVTFDLFNTIKDTDGADEDDVVDGLIAPGTSGAFDLGITNASEVTAKYIVEYEITNNAGVPLEFKVGSNDWTTNIAALNIAEDNAVELEEGATVSTQAVQWRWAYEQTPNADVADTKLGITTPDVTVTATITAWQVD